MNAKKMQFVICSSNLSLAKHITEQLEEMFKGVTHFVKSKREQMIALFNEPYPRIIIIDSSTILSFKPETQALIQKSKHVLLIISSDKLKAFDMIAFHPAAYILKPVLASDLRKALHTSIELFEEKRTLTELLQKEYFLQKSTKNIVYFPTVPGNEKEQFTTAEILHAQSDGDVTHLYFRNESKRKVTINLGIGVCEKMLAPYGFFRVHRGHLVNMDYCEIERKSSFLHLTNGKKIPFARRRKRLYLDKKKY